jgi:hypothetical protein
MPVAKNRNRKCQLCGNDYVLGVDSTLHKYCSLGCRQGFHADRWKTSKRDPAKRRNYWLKHKYGISLDDFNELLNKQNHSCAICKTEHPMGYGWHVDHSHKTGQVRGILCQQCNQGLGLFNENISTIEKAIKYLENC